MSRSMLRSFSQIVLEDLNLSRWFDDLTKRKSWQAVKDRVESIVA